MRARTSRSLACSTVAAASTATNGAIIRSRARATGGSAVSRWASSRSRTSSAVAPLTLPAAAGDGRERLAEVEALELAAADERGAVALAEHREQQRQVEELEAARHQR